MIENVELLMALDLIDRYGGGLTENDADLIEYRADSFLSMLTMDRNKEEQPEGIAERLKMCRNELLDFLVRQRLCPDADSETVADWSRTKSYPSAMSEEGKMRDIVYRWLGTTGLLYRGM